MAVTVWCKVVILAKDAKSFSELAAMVAGLDFRVAHAAEPEEARTLLGDAAAALLVVSEDFPDPVDAVAKFASGAPGHASPVLLMVPGDATPEFLAAAYAAGATDCVPPMARAEALRRKTSFFLSRPGAPPIRTRPPTQPSRGNLAMLEQAMAETNRLSLALERVAVDNRAQANAICKELRTRLHALLGLADMLLESELSATQRELVESMTATGQTLLQSATELLDCASAGPAPSALTHYPFDLRACIESTADALAVGARAANVSFTTLAHHGAPGMVQGDAVKVRRTLTRLASAAIAGSPAGGEVTMAIRRGRCSGASIRLEVTVHTAGNGVARDALRKEVEADGHALLVVDAPEGGVMYRTELLLSEAAGAPEAASAPLIDLTGRRVLVVDEDAASRRVLIAQVERWGCVATGCGTAAEGRAQLERARAANIPFAAALISQGLPDRGGLALGASAHHDPMLADTRLALIASTPRAGDAARAESAGFAAYLVKPVRPFHLHEALQHLLREDGPREIVTQHSINDRVAPAYHVLALSPDRARQIAMARLFEELGHRCDIAESGRDALEAFEARRYDLALIDCDAPDTDALHAVRKLRALSAPARDTPLIGASAESLDVLRERGRDAGLNDALATPFDALQAALTLERWLWVEPGDAVEDEPHGKGADPAPINIARIETVADGDANFRRKLLDLYVDDCRRRLKAMRAISRADEADALRRQAHAIKGASANVGATAVERVARTIESSAGDADSATREELIGLLTRELDKVETFLEHYHASRTS